jgi:hypothetical protein
MKEIVEITIEKIVTEVILEKDQKVIKEIKAIIAEVVEVIVMKEEKAIKNKKVNIQMKNIVKETILEVIAKLKNHLIIKKIIKKQTIYK